MARWDPTWIEELRDRNDIVAVISETVPLKQQGRNWIGRCPFHDDRTPSFSVSPDKQMYYCFGCQAGGDVFSFIMQKDHCSFPEAVATLARRVGMALPAAAGYDEASERRWRQRQALYRAHELAARFFEAALRHEKWGAKARRYLQERGISEETQKIYRLGYALPKWNALMNKLNERGVTTETLVRSGLCTNKQGRTFDRFRDRLMFPITDVQGRVIAFGGRAFDGGEPKYLNSPETELFHKRKVWYGLHQARPHLNKDKPAIVVEGYFDVITCHQAGIREAIASLGTALSPEQVNELSRFAREAVIAYDGDAAGAQATQRGLQLFEQQDRVVRVCELPEGMDPDEWIRQSGPEPFRRAIESALPLFEAILERACRQYDITTVQGRYQVMQEMIPVMLNERQPVKLAAQRQALAERLGFEEQDIIAQMEQFDRKTPRSGRSLHIIRQHRNNNSVMSPETSTLQAHLGIEHGDVQAEEELLRLLTMHPEWVEDIRQKLGAHDFSQGALRTLAEVMLRSSTVDTKEDWFDHVRWRLAETGDVEALQRFAELAMEERDYENPRRVLEDCLNRLVDLRRIRKRIQELRLELRRMEQEGQQVSLELLTEYQECLRALKSGESRHDRYSGIVLGKGGKYE